LSWKGESVPLTRKTFDLLMYLVDHANRVIGKDELL
jgi:DNA-binding winged helix-turn-helix (wHTH) protein